MHAVVLSLHTSPTAQPGSGDAGGMNVYVSHTVSMLARAGHTVDVITADAPRQNGTELPSDVRVHHLRTAARSKSELGERAADLARRLAEDPHLGGIVRSADVIWAHYWISGLVAVELRAALAGAMSGDHSSPPPTPALAPSCVPALTVSFHTVAAVKDRDLGEFREPAVRREAEVRIAAEADLVMANSRTEAADLENLLGADPARIAVAPPGVDTTVFRPGPVQDARRAVGEQGADLLVLCVGRMQYVKGTDLLIAALEELIRTDPLLAGRVRAVFLGNASGETDPGGLREAARISAASHLIEFRDPVPAGQVADWYRAADLVVVPSRSESFGLVAAEAQASGAPVLAADVGGLRHIVRPGATGVMVTGDDPVIWARGIAALLHDPALRCRLGEQAGLGAHQLDWSRAETAMLAALESVLPAPVTSASAAAPDPSCCSGSTC